MEKRRTAQGCKPYVRITRNYWTAIFSYSDSDFHFCYWIKIDVDNGENEIAKYRLLTAGQNRITKTVFDIFGVCIFPRIVLYWNVFHANIFPSALISYSCIWLFFFCCAVCIMLWHWWQEVIYHVVELHRRIVKPCLRAVKLRHCFVKVQVRLALLRLTPHSSAPLDWLNISFSKKKHENQLFSYSILLPLPISSILFQFCYFKRTFYRLFYLSFHWNEITGYSTYKLTTFSETSFCLK